MDMFRHNNIAEDTKSIAPARLLQSSLEEVARYWIGEIRKTVVTTEGEEMEVPCLLVALEPRGHVTQQFNPTLATKTKTWRGWGTQISVAGGAPRFRRWVEHPDFGGAWGTH